MEKYKVMVSCATHMIEFVGHILEMDDKEIVMELDASSVVVNRQFVVFIQTIEEKPEEQLPPVPVAPQPQPPVKQKLAQEFVKRRLRHDPMAGDYVDERMVPMSQLPDQNEELVMPNSENIDEEDLEVMKQVQRLYSGKHPITQQENLADAVKEAMTRGKEDYSMQNGVQYANPLRTVLKHGNPKKSRNS